MSCKRATFGGGLRALARQQTCLLGWQGSAVSAAQSVMPHTVRRLALVALFLGVPFDGGQAADDFRQGAGADRTQAGVLYLRIDATISPARVAASLPVLAARAPVGGGLAGSQAAAPAEPSGLRNVMLRLADAMAMPQESQNTVPPARPADHTVTGLLQAYEAALQSDPAYRAAVNEGLAGQEFEVLGFSNFLPSVTSSAGANKNRSIVTTDVLGGGASTRQNNYPSTSFSIQLRQPLFNLDVLARYRQGIAQSSGSAALLTMRGQELILRVVSLYAAAKYEEYQLTVAVTQRDTDVAVRKVSERRFANGEGTRPDMLEAQAKAEFAEAQLLQARDRLEVARDALSYVVGKKIEGLVDLSGDFPVKPTLPARFDEWRAIVLEKNFEIAAQRHAVEVAREEINKARAGHAPRLDAIASVSKGLSETISTLNQKVDTQSIGLQLTIPLYSGGSVSALYRQAFANHEKAKADLDAKINQILIELRKQHTLVISSAPLLISFDKSINAAQMQINAAQAGVRAGANTNVDVLNAARQMAATQRDFALARLSYLVAYLRLRQAAGTLSVADLQEVATYFGHPRSRPAVTASGAN